MNQTRVIYQETPRDFRTEIPNIVFELLEAREITANDLVLYSTYRRIAGEHGACWTGQRKLVEKCGLVDKTIKKSKMNLSRKFDQLGGKSLIEITACHRKSETPEVVTIVDIWPENHQYFKNKVTCRKVGDTGVVNGGTRVSYSRGQKKEPYKKEPIEEIIAQPEPSPIQRSNPSPSKNMPAGGNNTSSSFYKCLDQCFDLSDRQKRMLMKHPEHIVSQAVKYAYHPTTQIRGGPVGRIKLLQYVLNNFEDFKEKIDNLDKPQKTQSKKDVLLGRFKRGEVYNGYEFLQDDVGVGFYKSGMYQPYTIRWDALNFAHDFLALIKKLGLEENLE